MHQKKPALEFRRVLVKEQVKTLADGVQQNTNIVEENTQRVELLASEVEKNAGQVQQGVQDVTDAVKKARQAAKDSASSAADSKNSADNAARSEQNAKSHADNAAGNAQQTAQDVTATAAARDDAERLANEAENSAQASGTARDESVDAAERARRYQNAASSAATSSELSANAALGHKNSAAEYARQAKISQEASADNAQDSKQYRDEAQQIVDDLKGTNATTTQKGLVQLCSDTDNDSEELAATPKAVKTVMDETKTKAPLDSPDFSGTPTTPTPDLNAKGREIATAAFVRALIAALVGSSPEALDTLNELAAALGNDPNFATTVTNALAGKQPLSEILTSLSGLITAGNKLPYFSDKNVLALANLTAVGRVLIGQNSRSEVLQYLGITDMLSSSTGNLWGSPGVGGLIMAAYCGESDDDNNRKLIRGNIVPGSRLGMITLSGSYSTTGTYVSTPRLAVVTPNNYPQAGTFIALSGNTMNTGEKITALVGLFVRVA